MSHWVPNLQTPFGATRQEISLVHWEQSCEVLIVILSVLVQKLEVIREVPHSDSAIFWSTQQHLSMLRQAIDLSSVEGEYCGDFFEVTRLIIYFNQIVLLIGWLWRHCNCFVMQMQHRLNVIFSFNFSLFTKIHLPVASPPVLLSLDVFLK